MKHFLIGAIGALCVSMCIQVILLRIMLSDERAEHLQMKADHLRTVQSLKLCQDAYSAQERSNIREHNSAVMLDNMLLDGSTITVTQISGARDAGADRPQ